MVQLVASRRPLVPRYIGLRLSADDYLALPDDGFKYQVINGVVVMSPSPTPRHQLIQLEIGAQIQNFLQSSPIARVFPDIDVRFAADLVYRPDLVVIKRERLPKPLKRIDVVPDLIVEILSPGSESMDEQTKLADYARFGVPEYWIVSAEDPVAVRAIRLEGGRYVPQSKGESHADKLPSTSLPGFVLDLAALRRSAPD